jgi:hypothetical protein
MAGYQFLALMARPLLSAPLPLRVYKYEGGGRSSSYMNRHSDALHLAHSYPTFCKHRESGKEGLRNRCPQRYTCTMCVRSRFWGAYSRLLASSARLALILFFVVDVVWETALRTPAYIDFVRLYRTYTRDVSCDRATDALSIGLSAGYILFFVSVHVLLLFTAYASSDIHMHTHVIIYITLVFWIKLKLIMPNFLTESIKEKVMWL